MQAFRRPGAHLVAAAARVCAQASMACGQRVRKTQPDGGFTGLGMSPLQRHVRALRSRVGLRAGGQQRVRVRVQRAREQRRRWAPPPSRWPRYSTTTRSHRYSTTSRSCEMNSIVSDKRSRRSASRLTTCAWIDTSSADSGSSATMNSGSHRQRARDADALALAAGELVRKAAGVLGAQADQLAAARRCAAAVRARALAQAVRVPAPRPGCRAMRIFGFRLAYGSWKMICSLLRSLRMRLARQRADVVAAVEHLPRGAVEQAQHGAADGALARARFADQAERLAAAGSRTTRRRPRAPACRWLPK